MLEKRSAQRFLCLVFLVAIISSQAEIFLRFSTAIYDFLADISNYVSAAIHRKNMHNHKWPCLYCHIYLADFFTSIAIYD